MKKYVEKKTKLYRSFIIAIMINKIYKKEKESFFLFFYIAILQVIKFFLRLLVFAFILLFSCL